MFISLISRQTSSFRKKSTDGKNVVDDKGTTKKQIVDLKRVPGVEVLADHAMIGYCKIIAEINRNKGTLGYRTEPLLQPEDGTEFKVRMGFGLHAGWAIEGAVGSIYKVDATYLSPHVNMAARLETSSRQYGVPLLASHFVQELMSEIGQSKLRRLDIVTVKGSEVPISIFTYDALQDQTFKRSVVLHESTPMVGKVAETGTEGFDASKINLQYVVPVDVDEDPLVFAAVSPVVVTDESFDVENGSGDGSPIFSSTLSHSASKVGGQDSGSQTGGVLEGPPGVFLTSADETSDVFERDDDMVMLRAHITPEFLLVFKEGVDTYLEGTTLLTYHVPLLFHILHILTLPTNYFCQAIGLPPRFFWSAPTT